MEQSQDMLDNLNKQGYRLTPQRMMILTAIENSNNHISAEEIYAQVIAKYPNLNISTVYRTLELLKRLGLVTETDLGEGRVRYHPAEKGRYHHLICQQCGATIDLDEPMLASLKNTLLQEYKFNADLRHLAIQGYCLRCQQ